MSAMTITVNKPTGTVVIQGSGPTQTVNLTTGETQVVQLGTLSAAVTQQITQAVSSATAGAETATAAAATATTAATTATAQAGIATEEAGAAAASAEASANAYANIANGTATDAGSLTGAEIVPLSRTAGLLQTTISKIAAFVLSVFPGFTPNVASGATARTVQQALQDNPVNVRGLGVKGDGATDDTSALQAALNLGIPLHFPSGTYLYSAQLTAYNSIYGDGQVSKLQSNTAGGNNCIINFTGVSNLSVRGLSFNNGTATSYVANEAAGALRFTACSYYSVTDCFFNNCASQAVMNRSGTYVRIERNTFTNLWHDGIDVVKASHDVILADNTVMNGGDDAFAVVGYVSDGVRPQRVQIVNNRVFVTKYARGIAIVGAKDVVIEGNQVYQSASAGLYISAEAAYNSYGNDDVKASYNVFDGCGVNSNIGATPTGTWIPANVASVYIGAQTGYTNNDIDISHNTIRNVCNTPVAFQSLGGTHHSIRVSDNNIRDNWDPYNKNGFSLTTNSASTASATLSFGVVVGVACGMSAWYFNGTNSVLLGTVLSANSTSVTLSQAATVPSSANIVFSGIGIWGSLATTNASSASGSNTLSFANTGAVSAKDAYTIYGQENLTGIGIGQSVSGTNIPAGTYVIGVTANSVTLSANTTGIVATNASVTFTPMLYLASLSLTTSAATASGLTLTFSNGSGSKGVCVGQGVSGTNIPSGTYVASISGNNVTLSQAVTNTGVAPGASINFVGTGSLTSGSAISVFAAVNGVVSRNQLVNIAQYGLYVDGSCSGVMDFDSNTAENLGCVNAFGRFMSESNFVTGLLVRKRGNFMQLPPGWPKGIDTFIYAPASNWQYTEWHENNRVQNNAVGMNLGLSPATQTVGASPWTFTNTYPSAVTMAISGGAVTSVAIARNGQATYAAAGTAGLFDLKNGDAITVTYSSAPTATLIQRLAQ
jgi:trimeric autotransporter adhesin